MISPAPLLPSPADFGFPDRYSSYRPHQDEGILELARNAAGVRFSGRNFPTGSGKSLTALLLAQLLGGRTLILMGTRALQDQYAHGYPIPDDLLQVRDLRGQSSYPCRLTTRADSCEQGPCHAGIACSFRLDGCDYYDAEREAEDSQVVVTNYTKWATSSDRLGSFDTIIADEADACFDTIASIMSASIAQVNLDYLFDGKVVLPDTDDPAEAASWAIHTLARAESAASALLHTAARAASAGPHQRLARMRALQTDLGKWVVASKSPESWVAENAHARDPKHNAITLTPIWPGEHSERVLWKGTPRVILLSGTLTQRTMEMLGLGQEGADWDYRAYPSPIPSQNRRVTLIRTVSMAARRADYDLWTMRLDQIVAQRPDRKIIIHTVSYDRARRYMEASRHRDSGILISHTSFDLADAVARYRAREGQAVLVSPSLGRGYDFPYDECECIVIGKVPWPDTRSPVVAARKAIDPDYTNYEAMSALAQLAGRSPRFPDDRCEILVIDNDFGWFYPKYRHFAPQYFQEAVEWRYPGTTVMTETIPPPPPKLISLTP